MVLDESILDSLFLGAYWPQRRETRAECAARISKFLSGIRDAGPDVQRWFLKAKRKELARTAIDVSPPDIEALLITNDRDATGEPIEELGFRLGLWNGERVAFSATVGAFNSFVHNSLVLSFQGESLSDASKWCLLIDAAIASFDPDSAVVTNQNYISRHGNGTPDKTGGWWTYKRGGDVTRHAFP
jgi:hypothetical protein